MRMTWGADVGWEERGKPPFASVGRGVVAPEQLLVRMTRRYTDHAVGRVMDLLLPAHDKGWRLMPTPRPDLERMSQGRVGPETEILVGGEADARGLVGEDRERFVDEGMEGMVQVASAEMEQAREQAHGAEVLIEDWHELTDFRSELGRVVRDAAMLGTGILCGPVASPMKRSAARMGEDGLVELVVREELVPASRCVSPFNCFPDPEAGSDIQQGSFHWERDWVQRWELLHLLVDPAYRASEVKAALLDGPRGVGVAEEDAEEGGGPSRPVGLTASNRFEIWYGYMDLPVDALTGMGCDCGEAESGAVIPARVELVGDRIIRAELNPVMPGGDRFPYDYFRWSLRFHGGGELPWGRGVPDLVRDPQRALTACYNRIIQNMGLSSSPMIEYDSWRVVPENGAPELVAGKVWRNVSPAGGGGEGHPAIRPVVIQSMIVELIEWFRLNLQLMEDITGFAVGAAGTTSSAPDTVGGMQLVAGQSGGPVRQLARSFDDQLMVPHVRRYWQYLMLDETAPESLKGDFVVRAHGSGSLLERSMSQDALRGLAELSLNPAFGLDARKVVRSFISNAGMDWELYMLDDEQQREVDERQAAMAAEPSPQERVATIRAEADLERERMRGEQGELDRQTELEVEDRRTQRNMQDVAVEELKALIQAEFKREEMRVKSDDAEAARLARTKDAMMAVLASVGKSNAT